MKSKLLFVVSLFCGVAVMAQEDNTKVVIIAATSVNTPTPEKVNVYVGSQYSPDFDNDGDKSKKMGNPDSPDVINFYAYCAGWKDVSPKFASSVADSVADGLPFIFEPNKIDDEYTIKFTILNGTPHWYFYDAELDSATLITDGGTYKFSQPHGEKAERFSIYELGEFTICYQNGDLVIDSNPYTTNIVVKNESGELVVNETPKAIHQEISLETLDAGHYTVELNGGEKKYIIAVKPEMKTEETPVP